MKLGSLGLLLALHTIAPGCAPPAPSAQPSTASQSGLTCPEVPHSRSISGVVRDGGGDPVYLAAVIVIGTRCGTSADSLGRWVLAGAPMDTVVLQASFIGYRTTRLALPASERDSTGVLFRLGRAGEPDIYLPGPIPAEDLRGMLEAVINFYGPRTEAAGNELDTVAAMTGSPPPTRRATGPFVVLDSSGRSIWKQIPTSWLAEWLTTSRIAGVCASWQEPACKGLGLTSFLRLFSLPRRTAPDTAYVTPMVDVLSVQDCETQLSMGHMSEDLLRITRNGQSWSASVAPGGLELEGTVICEPQAPKRP